MVSGVIARAHHPRPPVGSRPPSTLKPSPLPRPFTLTGTGGERRLGLIYQGIGPANASSMSPSSVPDRCFDTPPGHRRRQRQRHRHRRQKQRG
ncbi:hypothetical protein [Azospirillum argentinense]